MAKSNGGRGGSGGKHGGGAKIPAPGQPGHPGWPAGHDAKGPSGRGRFNNPPQVKQD